MLLGKLKLPSSQSDNVWLHIISLSTLLFAFSPFSPLPWGSAYRYLFHILLPLSVLYLLFHRKIFQDFFTKFKVTLSPFIPFLICYLIVLVIHHGSLGKPGVSFGNIALIIVFNVIVFALIQATNTKISSKLFFIFCAIASWLFFIDCLFIAYKNGISIWEVRPFVKPYATIYGRCMALIGGLSILGAFYLSSERITIKAILFISGLIGFFCALGILTVRSTIAFPLFAAVCALWLFFRQKNINKTKKRIVSLICLGIIFLFSTAVLLSSVGDRFQQGFKETSNVLLNPSISQVIEKTKNNQILDQEEEQTKRHLNNSMGGRFAVWQMGWNETQESIWFGTGKGSPSEFVDTKKLFSYSKDYLPHFHSDYMQCFVVGGLVLLGGFIFTIILLVLGSLHSPIKLFLTLSLLSCGIIDLGFLDLRAFTCYCGAWFIVGTWESQKS